MLKKTIQNVVMGKYSHDQCQAAYQLHELAHSDKLSLGQFYSSIGASRPKWPPAHFFLQVKLKLECRKKHLLVRPSELCEFFNCEGPLCFNFVQFLHHSIVSHKDCLYYNLRLLSRTRYIPLSIVVLLELAPINVRQHHNHFIVRKHATSIRIIQVKGKDV